MYIWTPAIDQPPPSIKMPTTSQKPSAEPPRPGAEPLPGVEGIDPDALDALARAIGILAGIVPLSSPPAPAAAGDARGGTPPRR